MRCFRVVYEAFLMNSFICASCVCSSLLNGWQGEQFRQTLENNADLRRISNLAFIPGGSGDPSFIVSDAFFAAPVVTSVEVTATTETTVEEYTEEVNTVACGLFTCFQGSSSSSRRSVSRDEERTSIQMREGKEKIT